MARVSVYLADQLAEAVQVAGLDVSAIVQRALAAELDYRDTDTWLDQVGRLAPTKANHADVTRAVNETREELVTLPDD
jgi:post-segregation antitoxin (ccd killing protein)